MFLIRNINNINEYKDNRIPEELYGLPAYMGFEREIISTFYPAKYSEIYLKTGLSLTTTSAIWN
jgi:hypothetical protein